MKLYSAKSQKCKKQIKNRDQEQRRMEKRNKDVFFADAVKIFGKLWLQDCIIELAKLQHNKNGLEILYKPNETAQVKINTPNGDREDTKIREVVKQGPNIWTHYVLCINSKSKLILRKSDM